METDTITIGALQIPVHAVNTVILGSGAAGMGCAVRLWEALRDRGVPRPQDHIAVVTGGRTLGASRMSGSDKQTYYKMGTSPRVSDCAEDFARTLTAGGCMHGDIALAEALGSLRGFYGLVEAGVPFPHDPWGAFLGYKTDHDPYERATSAGPKTSRFMSECLEARARRCGVKLFDRQEALELLSDGQGTDRRIVAVVCLDRKRLRGPDFGLRVFVAENFVLAAGGPGQIYQASVYPRGQVGMHGLALRAGLRGVNFTESQYGLASTKFRWNVSGTYMQVVPRIFSTDARGRDEREFLTEYFPDMPAMATNIFLKGYQWPFDAQRIADHQSSLIDLAVHQETLVRGRRVWMDFLHNPAGRQGWQEFQLDELAPEARQYLLATGATQGRPIERLAHMNVPAIEIYAEHGIDLYNEPLEIAVCAQHHNGGFEVDAWWQSNLPHTFVIGEMAGTHGVKRPGGSALNAGQVGAQRAAEYIANVYGPTPPSRARAEGLLVERLNTLVQELHRREQAAADRPTPAAMMRRVGQLMSRHGAYLRSRAGTREALAELLSLHQSVRREGLRASDRRQLLQAIQAEHQLLTAIAMLKAIDEQLARGAGSRGSHCVLDHDGTELHEKLLDPATGQPYRARPENQALRQTILRVSYDPAAEGLFIADEVPVRPIPRRDIAFEPAWTEYRQGQIYHLKPQA